MAIKLGVQPTLPRNVARLMYLNNVPADNPKKFFEKSLTILLSDKFISELKFYFDDLF